MKYTEEHEWLLKEGETVTVGITEHAASELGDLVFIELPEQGMKVEKNQEIVVIESVKAASDIMAPLDGEIIDVNAAIVENPTLVNEDPTGEAWFFKMKLDKPDEYDELLDESAYKALIG